MAALKWGIIGAGNIGNAFADGLSQTDSCELVAVADMNKKAADELAGKYGVSTVYDSAASLIADDSVEIVYIGMPHTMHAEWSVRALNAGKHVLCEKPMAINEADAMTVIETARRNGKFFMEAFMFKCHPQTHKVVEMVNSGIIGDVAVIDASFSWPCGGGLEARTFNPKMGGGSLLDMGCYPVTLARCIAGAALGKDFAEPVEVRALAHIGEESKVDEWTTGMFKFDKDILARLGSGIARDDHNMVVIAGTKGRIELRDMWEANGDKPGEVTITLTGLERDTEEIMVKGEKSIYAIEAEAVATAIAKGKLECPYNQWVDSLGNMAAMDKWRLAIGLAYPCETNGAYSKPIGLDKLEVLPGSKMPFGEVKGLDKKVSKLVMGVDNQMTIAHATAMFDDFIMRGGNAFDTANIYDDCMPYTGETVYMENLMGQWLKNRGIRDEIVLIGKGAHTPNCNPEGMVRELEESLGRLQVDAVDIYFLHRDNPEVPVGEFVDALNEQKDKGRMTLFGGSNWSMERVMAANEYAAKNGKQGFAAMSNNFSLAQMVQAVWAGGVASSAPEFRKWHEDTQTSLFAWSSQARGFFVPGVASPEKKHDPEMYESWYSADNFSRQARCFELAEKKGLHPCAVVLAYVLGQKFPVFALIGPRKVSETTASLAGLDVTLTEEEMSWLNLED